MWGDKRRKAELRGTPQPTIISLPSDKVVAVTDLLTAAITNMESASQNVPSSIGKRELEDNLRVLPLTINELSSLRSTLKESMTIDPHKLRDLRKTWTDSRSWWTETPYKLFGKILDIIDPPGIFEAGRRP